MTNNNIVDDNDLEMVTGGIRKGSLSANQIRFACTSCNTYFYIDVTANSVTCPHCKKIFELKG